jgi:hypothetical protein
MAGATLVDVDILYHVEIISQHIQHRMRRGRCWQQHAARPRRRHEERCVLSDLSCCTHPAWPGGAKDAMPTSPAGSDCLVARCKQSSFTRMPLSIGDSLLPPYSATAFQKACYLRTLMDTGTAHGAVGSQSARVCTAVDICAGTRANMCPGDYLLLLLQGPRQLCYT